MTAPDPGEGVAEPAPAGSGPPRSGRLARARGGNWPCDDDVCTRPAQSASPIRGRAGGRAAGGESIVPCRSRGRRRARPAYTRPVDGFDQGEDGGGARVGPERSVPKQVITDQRTDLAAEQEEARARRRDARYGRCGSVQFRPQSAEPQAAARREGWRPGICFESTVRRYGRGASWSHQPGKGGLSGGLSAPSEAARVHPRSRQAAQPVHGWSETAPRPSHEIAQPSWRCGTIWSGDFHRSCSSLSAQSMRYWPLLLSKYRTKAGYHFLSR